MRPLVRPLLALAVGVLAARCREAPVTAPPPITTLPRQLSAAEQGLIARDNQFAFTLFGEIARQAGPDSNLFISPLSTAMALGMAYTGAAGATQTEMQQVLQLDGLTLDDVERSYRSLIALLRGLDPQVAFTLANSVWYDPDPRFAPTPDFLAATRTYFDARVESLDFRSPSAAPTINSWVSDQTGGKIPAIVPDPIGSDVVAYLIDAIYFKGSWTTQFDGSRTRPGPFRRADFTRMNPSGALCITDVMHKAFVDVNEEGTEAAAATAVGIGVTSVPASIVVDRPFVFAIRERLSGTILFLGRVMNPAAS